MEVIDGKPYLPGAASLLHYLDDRILVILSDGRNIVGTLRSFDHFMNLTMENTCERVILSDHKVYCDIPLGLYVVRSDSIVLVGSIDSEKESNGDLTMIPPEKFAELSQNATSNTDWVME